MRVVWITHNYPRHAGDVAGAFLHPLAVALRRADVDVRVIAPSDEGRGGQATLDGVPVHRVRYAAPRDETLAYRGTMADAVRSIRGLSRLAALRRALRDGAQDALAGASDGLVHAHWWIPGGLAAPPGVPLVLTCHGTDVRLLDRSFPARWLARPVIRRARVVTAVSRTLATTIERRTGRTIPDADIQPMPVVSVPRPASTGGGGLVVLGRLSEQKRVDLALNAFALLHRELPGLQLTVVGDGPAAPELHAHAAQLALSGQVRFAGEIPPDEVPGVFATADCCLMPARHEGLGLAAAEALMQGVPVVICEDGGGLLDIVPASGAGRIAPPDASALAGAVRSLLGDPTARESARQAGEQWHQRLAPEFVAERCRAWYERALHA